MLDSNGKTCNGLGLFSKGVTVVTVNTSLGPLGCRSARVRLFCRFGRRVWGRRLPGNGRLDRSSPTGWDTVAQVFQLRCKTGQASGGEVPFSETGASPADGGKKSNRWVATKTGT